MFKQEDIVPINYEYVMLNILYCSKSLLIRGYLFFIESNSLKVNILKTLILFLVYKIKNIYN